MTVKLINRRTVIASGAAALAAPAISISATEAPIRWRMVTSWPKNLPGPGVTARRLTERIMQMSDQAIHIELYGAGELVSAFEVLDAVGSGAAHIGHSASFFWQGKMPASAFFTAIPFGLIDTEHAAWIDHGGGQVLWETLYEPFGVVPFMAGNTGMGMGGWFKREIRSLDDLKGLKYRIPGIGGEVMRRLGALPVSLAPAEILPALQSGAIDGAEFVGPWSDLAFGFHKIARNYYWPGFHEPNGSAECLVNREAFAALPAHLREIVRNACAAENAWSLGEALWHNAEALRVLVEEHEVSVRPFPDDVVAAAREMSRIVLAELADRDEAARAILDSYAAARERAIGWSNLSTRSFLNARGDG